MRPPGCAPNAMWADPRESLRARAATTPASSRGSGNDCKAESTSTSGSADQLDKAGQTILQMLHRAAGVAEENSRHALETAQKLSDQLRAAEDRVAELEAEVTAYQNRAERAEQWLHRVYTEIEERFLQQSDSRRAVNGAPQRPQNVRRSR